MLFSRPVARNVASYDEIRDLYRASSERLKHSCPFGLLVGMSKRRMVDFRAYFDELGRLRGISLCSAACGMVMVAFISVCDCPQGDQVVSQILASLECRYQSMAIAVNAGGVWSYSSEGQPSENLMPVLRAAGFVDTGYSARNGRTTSPIVQKGRLLSDAAARVALRSMPASVVPAVQRS